MPGAARQRAFTLIEAIMVIAICAVVAAIVAVFIGPPLQAYFDTRRRAILTDVADTALRRIARDVGRALPNSVRAPTNASACIEFIPTRTGGRYRVASDGSQGSDALDFSSADSAFNMYGPQSAMATQRIAVGDLIAVNNLGIPGADAYLGDNTSAVTAAPVTNESSQETTVRITAKRFSLASPSSRFQVIPAGEQVVDYVCTNVGVAAATGDGTGVLYRLVNTLPRAAATSCPSILAATPVLADGLSACSFVYAAAPLQRNGLLSIWLEIRRGGETVALQHQVGVENTP